VTYAGNDEKENAALQEENQKLEEALQLHKSVTPKKTGTGSGSYKQAKSSPRNIRPRQTSSLKKIKSLPMTNSNNNSPFAAISVPEEAQVTIYN